MPALRSSGAASGSRLSLRVEHSGRDSDPSVLRISLHPGPPGGSSPRNARDVHQAVVRGHQRQSLDGSRCGHLHRDATPEAASRDGHVRMPRPHLVEHRERIGDEPRLGGAPGTASVASIIDEIQRAVRKRLGRQIDVPRHVLRVAAEVEEGALTRPRRQRTASGREWLAEYPGAAPDADATRHQDDTRIRRHSR